MEALATTFAEGMRDTIARFELPWSVNQLGTRCEYRFMNPAPRNGGESVASADGALEDYLHLYGINRGVLITPFHNMALMCPATTASDVAKHQTMFDAALEELVQ
jgi:glutamate-1-semialdehyde 2,1-aminomutase